MPDLRFPFADYLDDIRSAARLVPLSQRGTVPTFDALAKALPYDRATIWRATAGEGKVFNLPIAHALLRHFRLAGFQMEVYHLLDWGDPHRHRKRIALPSLTMEGETRLRFALAPYLALDHAPTKAALAAAAGVTVRSIERMIGDSQTTVTLNTLSVMVDRFAAAGIPLFVEDLFL